MSHPSAYPFVAAKLGGPERTTEVSHLPYRQLRRDQRIGGLGLPYQSLRRQALRLGTKLGGWGLPLGPKSTLRWPPSLADWFLLDHPPTIPRLRYLFSLKRN